MYGTETQARSAIWMSATSSFASPYTKKQPTRPSAAAAMTEIVIGWGG